MLRQIYPVLLSITVAVAIGVYMQPGEARKWIQHAGHWGGRVLNDALRATSALASEPQGSAPPAGYASTKPDETGTTAEYSSTSQDPSWTYVDDRSRAAAAPPGPISPRTSPANYPSTQSPNAPARAAGALPFRSQANAYPRVLADGDASAAGSYQQPGSSAAYPETNPAAGSPSGSPYATSDRNPLRPNMPKAAPWATDSSGAAGTPPASGYQQKSPGGKVVARYPKVQWAGDWRDYRGVPETVKPADQARSGFLPPPDVEQTTEKIDRYLPGQTQREDPAPSTGSAPPSAPVQALPPNQAGPPPGRQSPPSSQAVSTGGRPSYPSQYPSTAKDRTRNLPQPGSPSRNSQARATPFPSVENTHVPQMHAQGQPGGSRTAEQSPNANPTQHGPADRRRIPRGAEMESPDPVADLTLCQGAQILARVGSEVVLASEILPVANRTLSGVEAAQGASEEELSEARRELVRRILPKHIEMKLLYVDAKRNLPPEAIDNIKTQLSKRFEEVEVTNLMKELQVNSRRELEEKLAEWGSSLEHEKQAFIEKAVAQQWVFEKVRQEDSVTHEELLDYYREHATDYDHPTRVRWEHLEVTFEKHPNKREAWQLIAEMGNAVQQGRPLAEVAKERSEGVMASRGGKRDWITQGSLKSEVLDRALFSLPVGRLSRILEDETGFHIVRVVEREDAYRTPFEEVQGEIRKKLKEQKKQDRLAEFVGTLRDEIPVWTVFDEQTADPRTGSLYR